MKLLIIRQAQKWLHANAKKYAIGAGLGVVAVAIAKALIRKDVPLIGGLTMRLVPPALLLGPFVGAAGVFIRDNGGWKNTRQIGWVDHSLHAAQHYVSEHAQLGRLSFGRHANPALPAGVSPLVHYPRRPTVGLPFAARGYSTGLTYSGH